MRLETKSIHSGYETDPTTKSVAVPIYQTTSYEFDDTQHGADLFALKTPGNIYTRIMNPTNDVLEKRLSDLEGGVGGLCLASGMAAITYSIQTIAGIGDNIIAISNLYGGTFNYFAHTLPTYGVEVRFVDPSRPEDVAKLCDERTKAVYGESIGNPSINVLDIPRWAEAAHEAGLPLIIDNTVATPFIARPLELGADIIIHSLTKYIGGHGTSVGGIVIDGGKFDWSKDPKRFPKFNEPDPSYHGVVYVDDFGPAAFIGRCRVVPLRNTGAALSPLNTFLFLQGLESLAVRIERHSENALKIARHLEKHDLVSWVNYPGLESSKHKALIDRDYNGLASGLLSFGIKGGREAGAKFIDALELFLRLVNIGDAKSLACHPATTTHAQLNSEELAKAGVSDDLIRLSIGLEHVDDLIEDLDQALEKAR